MKMSKITLNWYHIAIPILLIIFCPIALLSIKPHVSPYIIAVAANEPSLLSPVSPVFSRAPYFVIFDIKENRAKYLVNNFANGNHEVGLHVTHLLLSERVGVVLGKNVGREPYEHLTRRGVKIYAALAVNVQEALYKYANKMLVMTAAPTGFSKSFIAP